MRGRERWRRGREGSLERDEYLGCEMILTEFVNWSPSHHFLYRQKSPKSSIESPQITYAVNSREREGEKGGGKEKAREMGEKERKRRSEM